MTKLVKNHSNVSVIVNINGVSCRIIGAKDREDKGVIFTPYTFLNLEYAGRNIPIREEHFTAWPNEISGKVHIHHTYNLKDQDFWKLDYSTLADNYHGDFATSLQAMSIPSRENRLPFKSKSNSLIVEIPPYNKEECTLIVCYTVASKSKVFPNLENEGINLIEMEFSKLRIGLYYTYLSMPSCEYSRLSNMSTSAPRINDGMTAHCASPLPKLMSELPRIVKMQISTVCEQYIDMFGNMLIQAGIASPSEFAQTIKKMDPVNTIEPMSALVQRKQVSCGTLRGELLIG